MIGNLSYRVKKIQPESTLIVDWSEAMGSADLWVVEYDTSTTPFRIWKPKYNRWDDTGYESIEEMEESGADVIWRKDHAK